MTARALAFNCQGATLVGVLHEPASPPDIGVVFVTAGGPQYRIGGHRQQALWARRLGEAGYAALCFDYRGVGDSDGDFVGYQVVDDDIGAAIDALVKAVPSVRRIILWGECNASSAILYYANLDQRVRGAVLLNPWVRTPAGAAQATLRYYYVQRLMQPSFWRKLLGGKFNPLASARSIATLLREARSRQASNVRVDRQQARISRELPLTEGMLLGLQRFDGQLMLVMSGRDIIAREFDQLLAGSAEWRSEIARHQSVRHDMADGDHTFSSRKQRDQVIAWAIAWLGRL